MDDLLQAPWLTGNPKRKVLPTCTELLYLLEGFHIVQEQGNRCVGSRRRQRSSDSSEGDLDCCCASQNIAATPKNRSAYPILGMHVASISL